jgi:long-subunit fatty acid transport protein
MKMRKIIGAVLSLWLVTVAGHAQFPEDALRLATPGLGVGARALGMGNAYTGVADDYTGIFWNPAGLGQAKFGELSVGLSYQSVTDSSAFFGSGSPYTTGSTSLNNLGLVYPAPVSQGSFVIGFGYQRQNNFTSGVAFSGFNPLSSYIQSWAPDNEPAPSDLSGNLAYQLYLADVDTTTGRFVSPIRNGTTQGATVLEGGGLNNWSFGGSIEPAKNVFVGATVTYVSGSYTYDRVYTEEDRNNMYEQFPYDFDRLTVEEDIKADISGWRGKFGLLFRIPNFFRLGLAVKTPTGYTVREDFSMAARARFDNGDVQPAGEPFTIVGRGQYGVSTPWVWSVGASLQLLFVRVAADVDFTDWTTLEFVNAEPEIMALNREMRDLFRPALNFRLGGEVTLWEIHIRAGGIYNMSPYADDPMEYDQKYVTVGMGFELGESMMLDAAYAHGWWDTYRINDLEQSRIDESIVTDNVLLTVLFRF